MITANNSFIINTSLSSLNNSNPFTSQVSMFSSVDTCEGYANNPGIGEQFNTCYSRDIFNNIHLEFNFDFSLPNEENLVIVLCKL